MMNEFKIFGYKLVGGGMCPEQYTVSADENGKEVEIGYLRLRHGCFTADYTRGGRYVCVYSSSPDGDGAFDDHEREFELTCAVIELYKTDRIVKNICVDACDVPGLQDSD
jgi:hypothetical protein